MSRKCTSCGEIKSLDDFHKEKKSPDGVRSRCKTCLCQQAREYHGDNRERDNLRCKAYAIIRRRKLTTVPIMDYL